MRRPIYKRPSNLAANWRFPSGEGTLPEKHFVTDDIRTQALALDS